MSFDWDLFSRYLAPVIGVAAGALINRKIERTPQLVSYLAHSSAVTVNPTDGEPFQVNIHSIVIHNAGRKAATNVKLGHTALPSFSVFPPCQHHTIQLPGDTGTEICFPVMVPDEQVTVTYLYFPPVLWSGINSYAKSDEGYAKILNVLPLTRPSLFVKWGTRILVVIGSATVFYGLGTLLSILWRSLPHA